MACDGVAFIVNQNNPDSVFPLKDLKAILSGQKNIPVVMDGTNATSTVRYLQETILHGAPFGKNVMARNGSDSVVSVIKQRNDAIGFVGISWVGNPNEPKQVANLKKIRLGLVECTAYGEKDVFVKPSEASITYGQYPLTRPIYYILKENAVALGTGFKNFMTLERGQLIFRSGGLAPAQMDLVNRKRQIEE
jgi:phosphate transport system substrate-binding protein